MKKIYKSILLLSALLISLQSYAAWHIVTVQDFSFTPASLNVIVGDTIIWQYIPGSMGHTTTSTSVPSGAMTWSAPLNSSSQGFAYQVTEVGQYTYQCDFHPSMQGTITVTSGSGINTPVYTTNFSVYAIQPSVFSVSYSMNSASDVKITLYDLTGKSVKILQNNSISAGEFKDTYYLDDLSKGVYIIELIAGSNRLTKRLIVE
jgi:plastocyanin